jgi:esterase/lipase
MSQKDLVLIINGAGTNGSELKHLYKTLQKNEDYFVFYPGIMPGAFVGDYFPMSTTKDFVRFIDSLHELINEPCFRHVYLIGYSLGCSTAAILSARNPRIEKVVLIAPLVKNPNYRKFTKGLAESLAIPQHLTRVQQIFYKEFIRRFLKIPKWNVFHLQVYLHFTKRYLKMLDRPTMVIETLKDELVKTKSIDQIEKNMSHHIFRRIKVESSHFLFFDKAVRDYVSEVIEDFLEEDLS